MSLIFDIGPSFHFIIFEHCDLKMDYELPFSYFFPP